MKFMYFQSNISIAIMDLKKQTSFITVCLAEIKLVVVLAWFL